MSAKEQILQLVNRFKEKKYLKDKTDDMGNGLLLSANLADEANERSKEARNKTVEIDRKYKELILANDLDPSKDPELVDIRNGYETAGERIEDFEEKTGIKFESTDVKIGDVSNELKKAIPYLNNGKLMLPSDFPKLPFTIYKKGYNEWEHTATPYNQFDWSDAVEVYIRTNGSTGNGLNGALPITMARFKSNFTSGVYGSSKKFILNITEFIYASNSDNSNAFIIDLDADILIRASNAKNYTWFGRFKNSRINTFTSAWVASGGVYKSTQTADHSVIDIVNLTDLGAFGSPEVYVKKGSLTECQNTKGSFYNSGVEVYVNPYDGHSASDLLITVSSALVTENLQFARTLMFENIGFGAAAYVSEPFTNINSKIYYFNCRNHRSSGNGFYKSGAYKVFSFDSVVSYASVDGFNYHATDKNSLAVEVNCASFGSGKYHTKTTDTTHSNNASTAHDGMRILRVGSKYSEAQGPIVADVNNCYSISIGIEASGIVDSTTGLRAAFQFYNDEGETSPKPKIVIESKGYGENVEVGVAGTPETVIANFIGVGNHTGGIQEEGLVWN